MAIDDNTSYELTGLQVKDLAQKVKAKADSSSLASVATSGDYNDLQNKPAIPAAQVNSDWNANSGVAQILNKPTLAAVATSGDYADLSNTPAIPTVYNGKLTITMNGTNVGEFTANQSTDTTIALTSGSSYTAGNGIDITNGEISVDTSVVATQNDLSGKQDTLTAGTNITINNNTISATDTTYSDFTGATSSVAGAHGLVPAPAAGDQSKVLHGDGTWKDATAKLVEMSYGESNAWAKFIAAYNAGSIVYCRASSNANPATGSQTRKAFMAYVNNATSPTSVEFQYVRSVSSKTDSQQCDQVFVYTLTNASGGTWSVASRSMSPKINVSGPITKTFTTGANATVTIGADAMTGATSSAAGTAGIVPAPTAGDDTKFLAGDGTWKSAGGGGGAVTYYIADGDPNYAQTIGSGFVYEDAARTTKAEAADVYADIQSGKTVYLEYRTGPATDHRETLFTITSMTRRETQGIADRYDYFGSMTSYMDGVNTNLPSAFGFLVQGSEPVTWQFVQQYIPTVNNGTLTIQQNGTNVQTFTADSATDKTANIDIHNGVLTADNLSPTADTTAAWGTLLGEEGVYWTSYSQSGRFAAQPQTYGYLETIIHKTANLSGWEVYQRWHSQAAGHEYYRSGNATGWYNEASNAGAFRRVLDDSDGVGEAITIYAATHQTVTTPTATYNAGVVVPLNTASTTFDSSVFELYGGGVRVKKAGTYLVQANFMIGKHQTNGVYAIPQTYKNANTSIANCYERSYSTADIWYGGSLAARAVDANANDVFYLRAAASAASYTFRFAGQTCTFLTVQKIA